MIQWGTVYLDLSGIRFGTKIFFSHATHGNTASLNPAASLTA